MAQQTINIGTTANDGTGDPLRTAFDKINDNFTELYTASPVTSQITLEGNEINTNVSNANLVLRGNGTGGIELDAFTIIDNNITGTRSNEDININPAGTGQVHLQANTKVTGTLTATGNIFANGNINLGDGANDQTKVVGVFEADNIQIDGTTITTNNTNGSLQIVGNGTGAVEVENVSFNGNTIQSITTNGDITLSPNGTGSIIADSLKIKGTTLSSDDSSTININEGVNVDGTMNVEGATTVAAITASGTATFNGTAVIDNITINDTSITTSSNADLNLSPGGTGGVIASGLRLSGTTISADDSSVVNINETLNVDGNTTIEGTLTTADITQTGNTTTTGNNTIQGVLTATSITTNDITTNGSNADLTLDPSGTGAVVINGTITHTGTQNTTGQFNADNIRLDGNTISATTGALTIDAAANQNITFNKKVLAGEADITLIQATTVRTDTLQNDTSDGDISISTQGTGVVDFNTATQTTVGSAGAANALPGTPTGYLEVKIAGVARVIPFYDKS